MSNRGGRTGRRGRPALLPLTARVPCRFGNSQRDGNTERPHRVEAV